MAFRDSFLALGALLAAFSWPGTVHAEGEAACKPTSFEGSGYLVCRVDPAVQDIQLFWRAADGKPYRTFSALADGLKAEGRSLVFAVNAGMYDEEFRPIGLYVEGGETLVDLNTADVKPKSGPVPNFYKKPNGVFYVAGTLAGIVSTEDFAAKQPEARIATQSGPLLVSGGVLHPALIPGSTDKTRRGGVGVCEGGTVAFATSNGGVNFEEFARMFRDHLGCPDALFLDGGRGVGLYDPALGRNDISWHGGFGPMLGVMAD